MISSLSDYVDRPPIVTEAREQFPRDSMTQYPLPRVGVQFRQNGWKPFNDPRFVKIIFEQGLISQAGNVSYRDLGVKECAFVDKDGRLIADGAVCPLASGEDAGFMQGDFHDVTFGFVRARLTRCDNGTDAEGKPLPGFCMQPHEIDKLVYEGVLYMFEQETDMRVDDASPFLRIRQWRREFVSNVHITTDVFFTVRQVRDSYARLFSKLNPKRGRRGTTLTPRRSCALIVSDTHPLHHPFCSVLRLFRSFCYLCLTLALQVVKEAQYIFDAYMPGFQAGSSFILLHDFQETYTDFEEEAAQYAAFYFRMANEMVRQRRSYTSLFGLFESWGAIAAFLYLVFGLTAKTYNQYNFNRQVRGLDIRKLDKGQFTPLGRLIDKSFQMPREYQCMTAD